MNGGKDLLKTIVGELLTPQDLRVLRKVIQLITIE